MELTITSVDYAPPELDQQTPLVIRLIKELPGDDRPDYWLGEVKTPITWRVDNQNLTINHVVIAARWAGTRIGPGAKDLPVGIAYVTDSSLLNDSRVDLKKCTYVAIGISYESSSGQVPAKSENILAGTIARSFGVGLPQEAASPNKLKNADSLPLIGSLIQTIKRAPNWFRCTLGRGK